MDSEVLALSPAQVAKALGITEVTVYRLIREGELPSFTIGRSRRIPRQALAELLQSRTAVPA